MGSSALRRPITRWESVLGCLRTGRTIQEAATITGLTYKQVASAVRDDPLYAEAYGVGGEVRLNRQARLEAMREINGLI